MRVLVEGSDERRTSPLNGLFGAAIEATEEAVYNALVAAETTHGRDGHALQAIPHERLQALLKRYQ